MREASRSPWHWLWLSVAVIVPTDSLSTPDDTSVSHSFSRSKRRLTSTASPKIDAGSREATAPASSINEDGTEMLTW